jgi:hypothetical protein
MSFLVTSGSISSGLIGSGRLGNSSVLSGNIGSGQIASGHLASGLLAGLLSGSANLTSGQVSSGFLGNNSVVSGSIASGQIFDSHFASGALINGAQTEFLYLPTLEPISGGRAVFRNFNGVGIADPTQQQKFPAIGVVTDNALSGQTVKVITAGPFELSSGMFPYGPHFQRETVYVLSSGLLGNKGNYVDYTSGLTLQALGVFTSQSGGMVTPNFNQQRDTITTPAIVSGAVVRNAGTLNFKYPDQGNILTEYQLTNLIAAEPISGVRAVLTASGFDNQNQFVRIAMAGNPTRMPAMGILVGHYASGATVGGTTSGVDDAGIITAGTAFVSAANNTTTAFSGKIGSPIFVGTSGEITTTAPTLSGSQIQPLGMVVNSDVVGAGSVVLSIGYRPVSGEINSLRLASGVLSSNFASGLFLQYTTVELISGARCVTIVASGFIAISRANEAPSGGSGFPCIGVVYTTTLSGQIANVMVAGQGPDVISVEGAGGINIGRGPVYVGTSGLLSTNPLSGCTVTQIGVWTSLSGGAVINVVPASSGAIGAFRLGSGSIIGRGLSGSPEIFTIASGSIGPNDLAFAAVSSGTIGAGAVGRVHLASGTNAYGLQWLAFTGESFSGNAINAVALASGQMDVIVHAERQSGLRLPAVGVVIAAGASGTQTNVFSFGPVTTANSGVIASGFHGRPLYVGSGGLIVNQSGFNAGPSSGAPFLSGSVVQQIGLAISGGIFVNPNLLIASGIVSTAQGNF